MTDVLKSNTLESVRTEERMSKFAFVGTGRGVRQSLLMGCAWGPLFIDVPLISGDEIIWEAVIVIYLI